MEELLEVFQTEDVESPAKANLWMISVATGRAGGHGVLSDLHHLGLHFPHVSRDNQILFEAIVPV